ncbi:esterase [Stenotrophomonas koreensis]|uniref:Esterase n=1 Tax=Stenotrophomonas koreensis TaxID=266128 RepID=A0A0R0C4Q5_9GAMM|nr:autotransporter domain-containing esterase [Stenotrophomonas koreensis]KRG60721.1 esterase [Stenotrophomonas koreensis]
MSLLQPRPLRGALALALALAAAPAMAQSPFSSTVFFGDSLTDSGHFRPVLTQINPAASVAGRFTTNPGYVWAEYLAKHYGTLALPNGNGQGGDNYAVGGARVAVDTVGALGATPAMSTQLATYLAANGGQADANALYTVWGGANDLFAIAAGAPLQATIAQAVTGQVGMVGALKLAGAQYVLVPTLPDIGLTPQSIAGGPLAMAQGTALASAYNQALFTGLSAQGLSVIPADTFTLMQEVSANPGLYGFSNATGMACTSGQSISCVPSQFARPDAATSYVFADGVHPSSRTHEILAQYVASVIDGPRQQQVLARSAQASGRARVDQVAGHLAPGQAEGTQWWGGLRADMQRYGHGDVFDGIAPVGLFGVDWVRDGHALGLFAGYGRMNADFGNSAGDFSLGEATVGGFVSWHDGPAWANAQLSYSWLDYEVQRQVNLGPAKRLHGGDTKGENLTAAFLAGWEFGGDGALRHGPVVGMTLQDISLDGYAEAGGGSTALSYGDQDANSLVGRVGWQLRVEGDRLQPYARLTWDHEFEKPEQASAMLQSLPVAGSYTVPGLNLDRDYGTAVLGSRLQLGTLEANVGLSSTFAVSGQSDTSVFATIGGRF